MRSGPVRCRTAHFARQRSEELADDDPGRSFKKPPANRRNLAAHGGLIGVGDSRAALAVGGRA